MAHKRHHEEIFRGKESLRKLAAYDIVICGAGALGSNLAVNLARMGACQLTIIDRDRVEEQNIGTQVYALDDVGAMKADILRNLIYREVGEEVTSIAQELNERTTKKFLSGHSLVVDALDNAESRKLVTEFCLANSIHCLHMGVNDQYGEIRWNETYIVPTGAGEDVCDYPLARNLIMLVVAVAAETIIRHVINDVKEDFAVTLGDFSITPIDA